MKKTTVLATLLLAGLALPTMAQANEAQPTEARGERPKPLDFSVLDANGDGELTKDELKGKLADEIAKFDTDGSGGLSEDEMPKPPRRK